MPKAGAPILEPTSRAMGPRNLLGPLLAACAASRKKQIQRETVFLNQDWGALEVLSPVWSSGRDPRSSPLLAHDSAIMGH